MPAQIPNTVIYQGEQYDIVATCGTMLPEPMDFGMVPAAPHAACDRGFVAGYELCEDGLFLRSLTVWRCSVEMDLEFPTIGSVQPQMGYTDETGRRAAPNEATYGSLEVPVPFTGKLRLGKGIVREFFTHQPVQKASAYETVLDLTLERGRCVQVQDRSEEAAHKRVAYLERFQEDSSVTTALRHAKDLDLEL